MRAVKQPHSSSMSVDPFYTLPYVQPLARQKIF